YRKGELTVEQAWLGKYFESDIVNQKEPHVAIRYIDPQLGWGVFALQDFRKMEFVAEYVGKVRKRKKEDEKNAYCFEYALCAGLSSPYTIDAQEQGAVARYINHSDTPNLNSALATFDHLSHVILFAKEPIAKGAQLCYDYGPDYWSKRNAPRSL
ncbi:MAG: SET domain-containing protein-lysine N-methyltransferase, partial [Verrucomicrobia bacterium]|nr:SET domain-containing protein-lysine N-methyltransferase [Verrucomicrobiota bacterium]